MNATVVNLGKASPDQSDFRLQYDPGNPAADKQGYVHLPNVNALVEMMDMRDAQRSYEANLQVMEGARAMLARTIDLLRHLESLVHGHRSRRRYGRLPGRRPQGPDGTRRRGRAGAKLRRELFRCSLLGVKDAVGTMHAGEVAATQGAAGKGDVVQVVNAVTAAELTLETVVAIRDRVISAYQDIMKMPI